jgi:ubiquinone/menaquinone biosynthesis C-methylase UbiE
MSSTTNNDYWPLPKNDPWSTPFAETLLSVVDLFSGASVLDIAAGGGIPSFHIAEEVGPTGKVLGLDMHPGQIQRAKTVQAHRVPWLQFMHGDMKKLPQDLPSFDRITGNLSFMFFRPNRLSALENVLKHLKPGGQIALSFPSLGTFDPLWARIDREMQKHNLTKEREALEEYRLERPSSEHVRGWLEELNMDKIQIKEEPLKIESNSGQEFLFHPLLRNGFLEDAYECFEDQKLAATVMNSISNDMESFTPLLAIRCAFSAWKKT